MSISALSGPVIAWGVNPLAPNENPDAAPSMFYQGAGMLDGRAPWNYNPGQAAGAANRGFIDGSYVCVDQIPSTLAVANIAASQSPGAGAITLVSVTGAGITAGVSNLNPLTGATISNLLAIDGAMGWISLGQSGSTQIWDPTKAISRNVRITSGGNDSGITFTVNGYDVYGFPMTETITGANAGIASGKKAFKYIASVTHTGSVASTMSIGTGDVYGFGLYTADWFYVDVYWAGTLITSKTGYTAGVTTTASATTGDVRGTYATQSASNGTNALQIIVTPSPQNLALGVAGLFGVSQF